MVLLYCKPTRNEKTAGRIAAGIARSLAIYTHASRDAFVLGLKMEKVCYIATSTGNQT